MNNWRLLLLAVVVVFQPIGSFTERNLIDGRECCERSEDARFYGTERRYIDGNREDRRTTAERRLKTLDESRGWGHEQSLISRSESSERRLSTEPNRNSRDQATNRATTRNIREVQNRKRDESRSSMVQIKRDSPKSRSRDALDTTRSIRISSDVRETRPFKQSRDSISRLPIRNSRSLEERRVSARDTVAYTQEREVITRPSSRHDTRLSGYGSDSRSQLKENRERRVLDRENSVNRRLSNGRDNEYRAQRVKVNLEQKEDRIVRAEMRRQQQDVKFRATMHAVNRDSEPMENSRDDSTRLNRNRMDIKNKDRLNSQQRDQNLRYTDGRKLDNQQGRGLRQSTSIRYAERMERRPESLDRVLTLRESRDGRLTRTSDKSMRDGRATRNRDDISGERREQRKNSILKVSTDRSASLDSAQRNSNDKMPKSYWVLAQRETLGDQRRRQTRDRPIDSIREHRETDREEESRSISRHSSEDRNHQRDTVIDSSNQQIRNNERADLRRRVLERSMEREIRMSRSAERRPDIRETTKSRLSEDVRTNNRDERQQTREQDRTLVQRTFGAATTQRLVTRLSRTENTRLERAGVTRNNVRGTDNRDMAEKVTRNVAFRRDSSRIGNIRPERLVRIRAEVTQNERREEQRDDTRLDRRSNERVQTELGQEIRDARNERSFINRDIRMEERLDSRRQHDVSSRGNERVLAERREDVRKNVRHTREEFSRNQNDVRIERVISEREHEPERYLRDVRGAAQIVQAERIAKDSRFVRDERNQEARTFSATTRDNREARFVNAIRERAIIRRSKDISMRSNRVPERATKRTSRTETLNERMIRTFERQAPFDNSDDRRESRTNMRSAVEHIATATVALRKGDRIIAKREESTKNVDDFAGSDDESVFSNWNIALYTLQGIYLSGLLVQLLTENGSSTKKRTFNWWSSRKDLIKVD